MLMDCWCFFTGLGFTILAFQFSHSIIKILPKDLLKNATQVFSGLYLRVFLFSTQGSQVLLKECLGLYLGTLYHDDLKIGYLQKSSETPSTEVRAGSSLPVGHNTGK